MKKIEELAGKTRDVNAHIFAHFRKTVKSEKYFGYRRIAIALEQKSVRLHLWAERSHSTDCLK